MGGNFVSAFRTSARSRLALFRARILPFVIFMCIQSRIQILISTFLLFFWISVRNYCVSITNLKH